MGVYCSTDEETVCITESALDVVQVVKGRRKGQPRVVVAVVRAGMGAAGRRATATPGGEAELIPRLLPLLLLLPG